MKTLLIPMYLCFQCFYIHAKGRGEETLAVIIRKGTPQLALPHWVKYGDEDDYHFEYSRPLAPWDEFYHFCPRTNLQTPPEALFFVNKNRNINRSYGCQFSPIPSIAKVSNANKLNSNWNNQIEWYISGYKINTETLIKQEGIPKNVFESQFEFESLNENETIISGLSAFYHKDIKQVIAVQYKLQSSFIYEKDSPDLLTNLHDKSPSGPDLTDFDAFFQNNYLDVSVHGSGHIDRELKKNGQNDHPFLDTLVPVSMVSPSHFITLPHKRVAWVNITLTSIWKKFIDNYNQIDDFLETVAQQIGKLNVTSGVTGIGSTNEEQLKRTYNTLTNENKIVVHDYLWKVVEFKHNKKMYGIILILTNLASPSKDKICIDDVCAKYKWLVQNTENEDIIYCCNMTKDSIEKLEIPFLQLEERLEFDLTDWGF